MNSDEMTATVLECIADLLERADCALIPDIEDTPTARDEVQKARSLLARVLKYVG